MKILFIKLLTILLFTLFSIFLITFLEESTYAQTPTETPTPTPDGSLQKISSLQQEIQDLQNKINELQGQKKTLASQIDVMNSNIELTELRIQSAREEIEALSEDISITVKKIDKLEHSLTEITQVLLNRISATYQTEKTNELQILLSSSNISDFFTKANYLRVVQAHDRKLIYETTQAKNDYANQRSIYEAKKVKVETLNKQLESYVAQLDQERQDKERFLEETNNSEREYQKRLADAQRELQQISKAAKILATTLPRDVKRGEPIGLMGNTGYSFGAHLHFGIYGISSLDQYDYYSSYENPANFLESKSIQWNTGCSSDPQGSSSTGSGSFSWPMSTDNLRISQNFGHTCYSDAYYRGQPHPAFDMYNNTDIVIRAVDDGKAYFCANCTGDGANGVFIFHSNGKMSLYWHLQ